MAGVQSPSNFHDSLQHRAKVKFIDENTELGVNDQVVEVDSSSNTVEVKLPNITEAIGRMYFITAPSGGTNNVTVKDLDDTTIWTDIVLGSDDDRICVISDGRMWWVLTQESN